MTTRRSFLGSILAAGVAPAAIGSGILMPVKATRPTLLEMQLAAFDALRRQPIMSISDYMELHNGGFLRTGFDSEGNYHAVVHPAHEIYLPPDKVRQTETRLRAILSGPHA